jgi:peroxiredoxin
MKFRIVLISLGVVMLLSGLAYQLWKSSSLREIPDIRLVTTRGERIELAHLRGKPLLVTFWATTCTTCMEEMPHLIDLYHELSPRGLQVIGIAMFYDPPNRVLAVQDARKIPYTIALDIDAEASRAFSDVELIPATFLFAPDGRLVYHKVGAVDINKLRDEILAIPGSGPTPRAASPGSGSRIGFFASATSLLAMQSGSILTKLVYWR